MTLAEGGVSHTDQRTHGKRIHSSHENNNLRKRRLCLNLLGTDSNLRVDHSGPPLSSSILLMPEPHKCSQGHSSHLKDAGLTPVPNGFPLPIKELHPLHREVSSTQPPPADTHQVGPNPGSRAQHPSPSLPPVRPGPPTREAV